MKPWEPPTPLKVWLPSTGCPFLRWLILPNRTLYGVVGALLNQRSHILGFHNSHTSWFWVNTGTIYQQKMTGKFTQSVRRRCSVPSSFLSQILDISCLFASLTHSLWGISGQVRGDTSKIDSSKNVSLSFRLFHKAAPKKRNRERLYKQMRNCPLFP